MLYGRNISHRFSDRVLFSHVNFSVERGEWVGILGPNGSGKTTLLRILSGFILPQEGQVFVQDRPLGSYADKERARLLGFVPQESHFVFPFSVAEVCLLGRYPHLGGLSFENAQDWNIVSQALCKVGLEGFEDRLVTELSGGEKQRVVLARALAQEPSVLLLDEPTTFLDLGQQMSMCRLLRDVKRDKAMVSVFHDLNLAAAFCDRLVVLCNGGVFAEGTPEEVLRPDILQAVYGAAFRVEPRTDGGGRLAIFPQLVMNDDDTLGYSTR